MATSQLLIDSNIDHQIAMIRYSQGRANTLLPFLLKIVDYLENRLAKEGGTIASKKRLNELLKDVNSRMDKIYSEWDKKEFQPTLPEVANNELDFQKQTVNAVVVDYTSSVPATNQVLSAAFNNPLLIGSRGGSVDFTKYTTDWKPQEIQRVTSRISAGFYSGETVSEISRAVVGLKSQRYADGILNMSRANIQGMVKTSVIHMSSEAKNKFNQENKDLIIGVRDVATLDSKTSNECRARDGNVYLFSVYGKNHPSPPYHINCRTTQVPELSDEFSFLRESRTRPAVTERDGKAKAEQVPATQTYYTWLKSQPAPVQNDALGQEKGKIFRNAGLSPDEFRKATVDRFYNPLTIEQMAAKNDKVAAYLRKQA